jgi:signal transduction histidine kinase
MSLSTRITLLLTLVLAGCGLAAGAAFHRALRRSAEAELGGRLDARLAWLEGALEVEAEDGEVELDAGTEPAGAAEYWQVSAGDGATGLWASGAQPPAAAVLWRDKRLSFGPPDAPAVPPDRLVAESEAAAGAVAGGRLVWEKIAPDEVPAAALSAARAAMAAADDLVILDARRRARVKKKDRGLPAVFEVRGTAGGREYELRVDAEGRVLRSRGRDARRYAGYAILPDDADGGGEPDATRLDLVLRAGASTAAMEAELARTARLLWTLGPAALAVTAGLLALLVRGQLRPLARMAEQAARVGPGDAGAGRIGPAGTSAELVGLRAAINAMLGRLADALGRERRFAATAAHELRTPLAQMRMTLDVALRRPRDVGEYREALQEVSEDVERLQRLVLGLLQLARGADAAAGGRPLSVAALLRKAEDGRGPVRLEDPAAAAGVWVWGDADLLPAALRNVLENAERHAPGEPPSVRVERAVISDGANDATTTTTAGSCVRIVVADRGPGVPEADRERIFEPLTRLDRPAAGAAASAAVGAEGGAAEGFGLGLAVARAAARGYGGDVICRGRSDGARGAEFVLTFRAAAPPDGGEDEPATATPS